jgi:hypothetical protein
MSVSNKFLNDQLRENYLQVLSDALVGKGEEVLRVGSNELALPCLDGAGNEKFIVVTVKVPTGSRDGDAYDGYSMAEDWEIKCKNKAETAKKKEAEKTKKIAKDQKAREKKAKEKGE